MKNRKILVTCPPMLGILEELKLTANQKYSFDLVPQKVTQVMSEKDLISIISEYDGWIIGDDPATENVFKAGKNGRLKAAVKWGVGIDNVDLSSAKKLGIPIKNTPGMFGDEVADLAHGYLICLARNIIQIHNGIIKGEWPKLRGESLKGLVAGVVGYGDIGKNVAKRLLTSGMFVQVYDPFLEKLEAEQIKKEIWPNKLSNCDFIILTCSLNSSNYHLLNEKIFTEMKHGVKIINVSRGSLINENDLIRELTKGKVNSVALDVFEDEPLSLNSPIRNFENCIFGSHNASNTTQAVFKTSLKTLDILNDLLI